MKNISIPFVAKQLPHTDTYVLMNTYFLSEVLFLEVIKCVILSSFDLDGFMVSELFLTRRMYRPPRRPSRIRKVTFFPESR